MKTPYAILIGLALIAAAIFFRQPSIAPAQAGLIGGVDGFECGVLDTFKDDYAGGCAILHGDKITFIQLGVLTGYNKIIDPENKKSNSSQTGYTTNWR